MATTPVNTTVFASRPRTRARDRVAFLVGLLAILTNSLATSAAQADAAPVVLVPVITDPGDETRLLGLARALQGVLSDLQVPTIAARYAAPLDAARAAGDSFANALGFAGDFVALRYEHYSDETARDHARRLAELVHARHALLIAAPLAHRFLVRRISRGEGESLTLPDPYDAALIPGALAQLVPAAPALTVPPPAPDPVDGPGTLAPRRWASIATAAAALGCLTTSALFAVKRVRLGNKFLRANADEAGYLDAGDAWRRQRGPMLATAAVGSAAATAAAVLITLETPPKRLVWLTAPTLALGSAALAWAALDLSRGRTCSSNSTAQSCVHAESQRDRGLLLALVAAPFLSFSAAHLGRWLQARLRLDLSATPKTATATVALLR